jgi:3-dehydroquinate dehydratase-2
MRLLLLHGPDLNLFGRREPHIYGITTLAEINAKLQAIAGERGVGLVMLQSNHRACWSTSCTSASTRSMARL